MNAGPDRRAVLGATPKQAHVFIRALRKVADAA
jgi:hypothetical protein